jgi:hypothetical protein
LFSSFIGGSLIPCRSMHSYTCTIWLLVVIVGAVLVGAVFVGVVAGAFAVVLGAVGFDALEDPLEELPHAPRSRHASEATSSAIVIDPRFLVLIRGMALLRGSSVCARII